jgi:hypothetical protein
MTIATSTRKSVAAGNGVKKAFPFAYKVFSTADVLVVQAVTATGVETVKSLTTDYTVALNANQESSPGGTVTMLVAPPTGTTLTLASKVVNQQPNTSATSFTPAVLNDALDRATIQIQQLDERLSRSVTLPISGTANTTLPKPAASKVLAWNSAGNGLAYVDAPSVLAAKLAATSGASLVGFQAAGSGATARTSQDKLSELISVKDFGAIGKGQRMDGGDDTDAIIAALVASGSQLQVRTPENGVIFAGTTPTVYFPSGVYFISRSLTSDLQSKSLSCVKIIGDNAIIVAPDNVTIFGGVGYGVSFSGLTFQGGYCAISIRTKNADSDVIRIQDCEFHEQTFASIQTDKVVIVQSTDPVTGKVIEEYTAGSPSTILNIEGCKFINFSQSSYVLYLQSGDGTQFNNNWVEVKGPCAFHNEGVLNMNGNLMTPLPGITRWVDNHHVFRAHQTRFGAEFSGCPIVHNYANLQDPLEYLSDAPTIILDSCYVPALGGMGSLIVAKSGLPGVIKITGCYGAAAAYGGNPAVNIIGDGMSGGGLSAWLDNYTNSNNTYSHFSIEVTGNEFTGVPLSANDAIVQKLKPYTVFVETNQKNGNSIFLPNVVAKMVTAPSIVGQEFTYSRPTPISAGTVYFDTGISRDTKDLGFGHAAVYDLYMSGNSAPQGSTNYCAVQAGVLIVGTSWDATAQQVSSEIFYSATLKPAFSLIGNLTVTPFFVKSGGANVPRIPFGNDYQIRIKVSGLAVGLENYVGTLRLVKRY